LFGRRPFNLNRCCKPHFKQKNYIKNVAIFYCCSPLLLQHSQVPLAEFLVPDWGDIVDPGISVVVPSRQQPMYPGVPVRQPYARVDYIPQSGTKNSATDPTGVRQTATSKAVIGIKNKQNNLFKNDDIGSFKKRWGEFTSAQENRCLT
jgi:hypothetical protein